MAAASRTYKVLGLAGSLRVASTNAGLLRYAQSIGSAHRLNITVGNISDLPLFNQDLENKPLAKPIMDLRKLAKDADAILFSCPEYNYSIPGTLKNAIDWLSRTVDGEKTHPLAGKPAAMMGGGGHLGSGRSQYHLRQVMVFLDMHPMNKPEVMVRLFDGVKRFDPVTGDLHDEDTKKFVAGLLGSFSTWCDKMVVKP